MLLTELQCTQLLCFKKKHACKKCFHTPALRKGHLRPSPRFYSTFEVIDIALVTVYGLNNGYVCPLQGRRRPAQSFLPQATSWTSRPWWLMANIIILSSPGGLPEARDEVLCRRRRRRKYRADSNFTIVELKTIITRQNRVQLRQPNDDLSCLAFKMRFAGLKIF
jgi:hypothetical protein